jgi:SAM-dependent methyltransferase
MGYEPGCANGELTAALAARCDRLLASDGVDRAVKLAHVRLRDFPNVDVFKAWVPDEWPDRQFDLIVLSEFLFYLTPDDLDRIASKAVASLAPNGVVLACHWRRPIKDCVLNGDLVHARLGELLQLPNVCSVVEPECRLDVWSSAPTAATLDGLA